MKTNSVVTFSGKTYKSILKTLFKEGNLPSVTKGFYGGNINRNNVSLEHLKPRYGGGRTELSNLVLATKRRNMARGNRKLRDFINPEAAIAYLNQFKDVKVGKFNGNDYIRMITKRLKEMNIFLYSFGADRKIKTKPYKRPVNLRYK